MEFPGLPDLLAERAALIETLEALSDAEFESGTTLCEGWAPRDILAHVLGNDYELQQFLLSRLNIAKANAKIVERQRNQSRERIMHRAHRWVENPAPHVRLAAPLLLGDNAVHHQDILRGLGRRRDVPAASAAAIVRAGYFFGLSKLRRYRIEPDDGGRALGFGRPVRGSSEALGMWLCGRRGIEPELQFEGEHEPLGV